MKTMVKCDINSPNGASYFARQLIWGLKDHLDLKVQHIKLTGTNLPVSSEVGPVFQELAQKQMLDAEVFIDVGAPGEFNCQGSRYNIGYFMPYASSIPKEIVDKMNLMDEIWTYSSEALDTMRAAGVKTSITWFPLLLGPEFDEVDRDDELPIIEVTYDKFNQPVPRDKRPMVIGCISRWERRKNIEDLLTAVFSEFDEGEVVVLLKTYEANMARTEDYHNKKKVENIRAQFGGGPKVAVVCQPFTDADFVRLYHSMDVYAVCPRYEAMGTDVMMSHALGLPTVASEDLEYVEEPVLNVGDYRRGLWWKRPCLRDLATQLRSFHDSFVAGTLSPSSEVRAEALRRHDRHGIIEHATVPHILEALQTA